MPIISTNNKELHRQLKSRAVQVDTTLGRLADRYFQLGLILSLENLTDEEVEGVKKYIEISRE